jgi:hypothetical protein
MADSKETSSGTPDAIIALTPGTTPDGKDGFVGFVVADGVGAARAATQAFVDDMGGTAHLETKPGQHETRTSRRGGRSFGMTGSWARSTWVPEADRKKRDQGKSGKRKPGK